MKSKFIILIMMFVFSNYLLSSQDLMVNPNSNITIHSGATLDVLAGNLVLASDATGDASLIDHGTLTFTGGGEVEVQRYLTEGQWHLISAPVVNAVSGMFLDDYLQIHTESNSNWTDVGSDTYTMVTMQGYTLWSVDASPTTEVYTGVTNTGTANKAFSQSGDGWNLVGNPYPSSVDWDLVNIPTELNGAIWLFDPTIGANGDYLYYINGGGAANTTSQYIPSGQGFFVRSTGGSGTLTFENNTRVHSSQSFYKGSDDKDLLVLKVSGNDVTSQTAIRFLPEATQQADRLFDVYKIVSDKEDVPNLFSKIGTENMAINTLPSIERNEVVPVWFRAGLSGDYAVSATEIETFDPAIPLYIEDIENGAIQNLRLEPDYSFSYKSGSDKGFLIYFSEPENSNHLGNVKIYSAEDGLQIDFPIAELTNTNFTADIIIFDVTGRKVYHTTTTEIKNRISFNGNNSIYLVSIISGGKVANEKVFIK